MPDFDPSSAVTARQPRAIVKVNGTPMPGWIEWEVNNNTHFQADTFRVVFALSAVPSQFDSQWWSSQTTISVEILAGFPADPMRFTESDLTSWIFGQVDEVDFDPVRAEVHLNGRDLTALLIDTKTTESWENKKASEIATLLAQRHGLGTSQITDTTRNVGEFYKSDNVDRTHQRSEWDLLTYLANAEGFVVYVRGQDLVFKPHPNDFGSNALLLRWTPPSDNQASPSFWGKSIQFTRHLTVARGIIVVARSWHGKKNQRFEAFYPKKPATVTPGQGTVRGGVQVYTFVRPDLTQQQLDDFVIAKHKELTRHEMKLSATLPADDALVVDGLIRVTGTGSSFDQTYFPDSITRRMSLSEGYVMTVSAKNHNPDTQVLA